MLSSNLSTRKIFDCPEEGNRACLAMDFQSAVVFLFFLFRGNDTCLGCCLVVDRMVDWLFFSEWDSLSPSPLLGHGKI